MRFASGFLCASVLALGMTSAVEAIPLVYTFDGTITGLSDTSGMGAAAGYSSVGQTISYQFIVDTALPGTQTLFGVTTTPSCGGDTCYFADYVSGGVASSGTGGYDYTGLSHYNVESNTASALGAQGLINITRFTDNGNGAVNWEISAVNNGPIDTSTISTWAVGVTPFIGFNLGWAYTFDTETQRIVQANTEIWSQLVLTSVCPVSGCEAPTAVPEPSTSALLAAGLGLAGISAVRRRRSQPVV